MVCAINTLRAGHALCASEVSDAVTSLAAGTPRSDSLRGMSAVEICGLFRAGVGVNVRAGQYLQYWPVAGMSVGKCSNTGLSTAQYKCMNVVGTFVGIDDFQVHQVTGNAELIRNAVATEHVTCHAGNLKCLAT